MDFNTGDIVYVTKYALSTGIRIVKISHADGEYLYTYGEAGFVQYSSKECFHSLEKALAHAETLREKKIDQLKRSIEKIKNKKIKVLGQ